LLFSLAGTGDYTGAGTPTACGNVAADKPLADRSTSEGAAAAVPMIPWRANRRPRRSPASRTASALCHLPPILK